MTQDWPGPSYHCVTDSAHSRGVTVMLRKDLPFTLISKHTSDDGRKILLNISIEHEVYTIVNIYAPNVVADKISFFKKLSTWIKQNALTVHRIILLGDF